MVYLDSGKYKISNIYKIANGGAFDVPVNYGLELCKKCGESWYTICFIKYDGDGCRIDGVGTRMLNIEDDEWGDVRDMIKTATMIVDTANKIKRDE